MLMTLGNLRDVVLQQTTPTRVAHRRALLVRQRTVYEMCAAADTSDSMLLRLKLRTQARVPANLCPPLHYQHCLLVLDVSV